MDVSAGKESAHNVGDLGSIPGLGRSLGEGKAYPLQYSALENSMNCIGHNWVTLNVNVKSEQKSQFFEAYIWAERQ